MRSSLNCWGRGRFAAVAFMLLCLSACGLENPVIDTFMYALPSTRQYADLRPDVEYLVVEHQGRASVMALGSRRIEGAPPFEDITEYWYNAQGEMLALRNGRIYLAIGTAQEWRSNESKPPRWQDVLGTDTLMPWMRLLDRMPGYRFDHQDQITTGRIPAPKEKLDGVPFGVQWAGDIVEGETRHARPWQYKQRFALLGDRVVYSEQCLSETICLKLRPLGKVEK